MIFIASNFEPARLQLGLFPLHVSLYYKECENTTVRWAKIALEEGKHVFLFEEVVIWYSPECLKDG
jgi:hypothetical protein